MIANVIGETIDAGAAFFFRHDGRWFETGFRQRIVFAVQFLVVEILLLVRSVRLVGVAFVVIGRIVAALFRFSNVIVLLRAEDFAPETNLFELTFVHQLFQREPNSASNESRQRDRSEKSFAYR